MATWDALADMARQRQIRRRRTIALVTCALLLLAGLTALFVTAPGPLASIRSGIERVGKPAHDFVNWWDETFSARQRNGTLTGRVQRLRWRLAELQTAEYENQQLRGLVHL